MAATGRQPAIERFSCALDAYPAAFHGNRLNLLSLGDAKPISGDARYLRGLDSLELQVESRQYCVDPECNWPFPAFTVAERPDPWLLSQWLFDRFELAKELLTRQEDIAGLVSRRVASSGPMAVALVIVDGLSYYDVPADMAAEPCLVTGVSITSHGYRAVIGRPSLSRRLFALGYAQQRAFTYYTLQTESLAAAIHHEFSTSQVERVREFSEVCRGIAGLDNARTYIQVTLSGLDQLCHAHRDRPPVDYYRRTIFRNVANLSDQMVDRFGSALVIVTADHGILWREQLEPELVVASDLFGEDKASPRYIVGARRRGYGRVCLSQGRDHTLFAVPYMTRRFRVNEWGVHGGLSAWESLVPLIVREHR